MSARLQGQLKRNDDYSGDLHVRQRKNREFIFVGEPDGINDQLARIAIASASTVV
jgi:hypothetical protein